MSQTNCLATAFLLIFITVGLSAFAYAQNTGTSVLKLPQDIEFKGPLTGPPQFVLLYGDSTKPGAFYVSRVRFSAGWKDPPHWHPELRTVVVLSGTLHYGTGDKWDEGKTYPPGTFYSEPSKAPHFTWAKDGEVIIQVTGIGPWGKTDIPQR